MHDDRDTTTPEADEQRDRLAALYNLALEITELRDLQQVLDLALRQCITLTHSQFGFIGLNGTDRHAMNVAAFQGIAVSQRFYERFHLLMPLRPPLLASAALDNQPVRSDDAMGEARRVGQPQGHPPVHQFLGVPLRRRDLPMGMIGLGNRAGGYTEEHERLLLTYAAQVAIAIHNANLFNELNATKEDLERAMLGQYAALRRTQNQQEAGLSDDDLQILARVADGQSNADIGAALHSSVPTVKRRLQQIFDRLGASSRVPAVVEAVRRGLI